MSYLQQSDRWQVLEAHPDEERRLEDAFGISSICARVMVSRGITSLEDAYEFLYPDIRQQWRDPLDMAQMDAAAQQVAQAIKEHKRIAVFGDFDVDGISATCLLTLALQDLGADVSPFIPDRFQEGYGMSQAALERMEEQIRPDLLITVDNGISAAKEVAWLLDKGIQVVITDHHEPGDAVPEGVAIVDPKLDPNGTSRDLAGVGVALKLVQQLGRLLGREQLWMGYIDIATLGTVSDMMALTGENRVLVRRGVELLREGKRAGIKSLCERSGQDLATLTADALPFTIVPRLNAAGRMGYTQVALSLLLTTDPDEASVLAGQLEKINRTRRDIEQALAREAIEKVERTWAGGHCVVVSGKGWHEGVKGIVASRISQRYGVPAILFSISEDGLASGSGRTVGEVDLFSAVSQCADLCLRFGGHAGAVGVTLRQEDLPAFSRRLEQVLSRIDPSQFIAKGQVAGIVDLADLTLENIESLECLRPFGQGNSRPLFATTACMMQDASPVGKTKEHLRFFAQDGTASVPAIMFKAPDISRAVHCSSAVDLVFDPVVESWQGVDKVKLMVKDIIYRDGPHPDVQLHLDSSLALIGPAAQCESADATMDSHKDNIEISSGATMEAVEEAVRRCLIGDHRYLPAQKQALQFLRSGKNVLCVMATGRGKSAIFHAFAAEQVLEKDKASLFIFPLRALVADQSYHLQESLDPLGIHTAVLTGESSREHRQQVYEGLRAGALDIVLTTPEFATIHGSELAESGRIGFVVIDEAHHAGLAKGGQRSSYLMMPELLRQLGNPVVGAFTATADSQVSSEICRLLDIPRSQVVVDDTRRDNLRIVDDREIRGRDRRVISQVSEGDKAVIYVNSRSSAVELCRSLRKALPDLAHTIAFYHAGLSRDTRHKVEEAFRSGELKCIVSTSAFGEGVNVPDIRHVFLYHLPYTAIEFNQMSGRAGRDGQRSYIHLLYNARDAQVNQFMFTEAAPARRDLVNIYRAIRRRCAREERGADLHALMQEVHEQDRLSIVDETMIDYGLGIFQELDLIRIQGYGAERTLWLNPDAARVELMDSIRYQEGIRSFDAFMAFKDWALSASAQELLERIYKPLTPVFGQLAV